MSLFLSTYVNKVDRKGRVSVPASWRARLAAQTFQGIVIFPSFTNQHCLEGRDMAQIEALSDDVARFDAFSTEHDDRAQLIFSQSRELPFDSEGRVLLPADIMEMADITTQAAFVGLGKTFQLWEPEAHKAALADIRKRAAGKPMTVPARPTGMRPPANDGGPA